MEAQNDFFGLEQGDADIALAVTADLRRDNALEYPKLHLRQRDHQIAELQSFLDIPRQHIRQADEAQIEHGHEHHDKRNKRAIPDFVQHHMITVLYPAEAGPPALWEE